MSKVIVSVLLPTYNRENDISSIIQKILNQSYSNFELIVVNDGSTDNTREILAEWKEKDSRIIVVNKENGGLSDARNAGIAFLKGEYVFFIDDDDDIPLDYIENFMVPENDGFDLIVDSYSNQMDDKVPVPVNFPADFSLLKSHSLNLIFKLNEYRYPFFAHGKRFKSSIIKQNNLKFSTEITFVEDRIFVLDYMRTQEFNTLKITNNHSYIVKSSSQAQYRLSQGHKPIDYLLNNFSATYDYLLDLHKEIENPIVKEYADNYVAEKLMDYVLLPLSRKSTKEEKMLVKSEGINLLKRIDIENVKKKRPRMVAKSLLSLGVFPTLTFLRLRSLLP